MGVYYTRDKDGLLQGFNIKGDAPSTDEMGRISAHLTGQPAPTVVQDQPQDGIISNLYHGLERNVDEYQAGALRVAQAAAEKLSKNGTILGYDSNDFQQMIAEQYRQRDTVPTPQGGFFDQNGAYAKTKYLAGVAGESASSTVGGLGGAAIGAGIGSLAGGVGAIPGAAIGGFIGNIIGGAPQMFDQNAQEQINKYGKVKDWSKVTAATTGQVAVETLSDVVTAKVAGILGRPLSKIGEEAVQRGVSRGLLAAGKHMGEATVTGTVAGGAEEAIQQALQRWSADEPLMNEEAKAQYLENAIVGGILQGAMGGALSIGPAVHEHNTANAEHAAATAAEAEALDLKKSATENPAKYQQLYKKEVPVISTAGRLEDLRSNLPAGLLETPETANDRVSTGPFSEPEYRDAVEKVRGQKVVAPDKIKNIMGIGRPKANALFQAMLDRGDATPAGSTNQYLRVPQRTERSYEVAPVTNEEAKPFQVIIGGKPRGQGFKTQEEANAWASSTGAKTFEVKQSNVTQEHGLYETTKTADGSAIGRRLVKQFPTSAEAHAAAANYDPAYSSKTNEQIAQEAADKAAQTVEGRVVSQLGTTAKRLQDYANKIIGPGRLEIQTPPVINKDYLRSIGVKEDNLPTEDQINEGVTMPDIKGQVNSIIGIAKDIYDPAMPVEQKTQKLQGVLTHELVHAMRNLDLLTPKEWDALTAHAYNAKVPGKPYTHMQWIGARLPAGFKGNPVEEGIAEMLRSYSADPTLLEKPARGPIGKLMDFVKRLLGLGKSYEAEDVMKAIFGGKIGEREVGSGGLKDRGYSGNPFYSSVKVPGFYLKTDKFLGQTKQDKASPDQWMGMLRNAGIRQEELDWLGVEDWMKSQDNKSIAKGDLQDYVRANSVDIQEDLLGQPSTTNTDDLMYIETLKDQVSKLRQSLYSEYVNSDEYQDFEDGPFVDPFGLWINTKAGQGHENADNYERADGTLKLMLQKDQPQPTFHGGTTQEGGKDYREFVFHIPTLKPRFSIAAHFNGWENIIAHARFKERNLGDGKRTLFIEEMQSDLHQRGRKFGYSNPEVQSKLTDKYDEYNKLNQELEDLASERLSLHRVIKDSAAAIVGDPSNATFYHDRIRQAKIDYEEARLKASAKTADYERIKEELAQLQDAAQIPEAPLKTTWDEFVVKRLVRHAAEQGFDQIAWHGEPDSVAHTEGYHGMWTEQAKDPATGEDKTEYYVGRQPDQETGDPGEKVSVSGIIDFYTRRLRNVVNKTFKRFNTGVRFEPGQAKGKVQSFEEMFPTPDDFMSFMAYLEPETLTADQRKQFLKAGQIIHSQRNYDPAAAFEKVGLKSDEVQKVVDQMTGSFEGPVYDDHGNPAYDKWVMPISKELKDSALNEGFPLFSAVKSNDQYEDDFQMYDWRNADKAKTDPRLAHIVSNPNFQKWFEGSKVVDDYRNPKVVYHGTKANDDFATFYELSHFGTHDAAADRLEANIPPASGMAIGERMGIPFNKVSEWWKNMDQEERDRLVADQHKFIELQKQGARVYPVLLSIKNPLKISDSAVEHDVTAFASAARQAGALSMPEFIKIAATKNKKTLIDALEKKGYDGFVYVNQAEDAGSWSYVAFRPQQVKSVYNRGGFNEGDPRIDYSATTTNLGRRVPANAPRDQMAELEAKITYDNMAPAVKRAMGWITPKKYKYSVGEGIDSSFINLQDRMMPIGRLIDRVRKNGGFVSNENDVYLRDTLFPGQTDAMLQQNAKDLYTPINDIIKGLNVTAADKEAARKLNRASKAIVEEYSDPKRAISELYLYAQHAIERNAEMRRRNENVQDKRPEQYDAGSGMTDPEAREILVWVNNQRFANQLSDLTRTNSLRSAVRRLIQNTNDVRVKSGISPDYQQMALEDGTHAPQYMDYVPLRSFIEEHQDQDADARAFAAVGKGFNIQGKEDKSATGRASLAANVLANAILQNEEAVIRANKAKVGQAMLSLVDNNATMLSDVAKVIDRRPIKYVYNKDTGTVRAAPDPSIMTDPMVLRVKKDGQQVFIRFTDARIAKAMGSRGGIGGSAADSIMSGLTKLNRFLAATRTSFNPDFVVSNMLRDLQTAGMNMNELQIKGLKRDVIKNLPAALKGSWQGIRTGDMSNEWARAFDEFKKMGGMTAYYGTRDLPDTVKKINDSLKEDPSGADPRRVLKQLKAIGNFVEDLNSTVENGIRLSTYRNVRDKLLAMTDDPKDIKNIKRAQERAASIAKNLTVNFNAGGEWKGTMNAMYLFYNAGIQGSSAMVNPFIRSARVRKMWAGVLLAGVLQDQLMTMLSPDDADGQKVYDKIPQYILEHNMIFMDPFGMSKRGYFQIPLPYLMNSIWNMGRAVSRGARGSYTPGQTFNSMFGTLYESLNPWGGTNNFLNFVAPTILDPVVDLYTNSNFANQPIAPPANPFGLSENASQRYWNNTSPAYVSVANWISRLTGSDGDYIPGAVEWSPNQIQYVADWGLGGVGTFLQRSFDLFSPVGGKGVLKNMVTGGEWSASDIPIVRRLYGNITTKNDLQTYIAGRDQVLRVRKELQQAHANGDAAHYQEIMQAYPAEYRISSSINKIENARKKISGQIKKVRNTTKIPDARKEELIKGLKARQDNLVTQANKLLAELK